ncbi:hypothetical protein B0H21DRAFT_889589 [Amylocystis lapponica]|nr:hypothetical protein B0H21DRAFT_889589 [Amylocystis lapponica]
MSTSSHPHWMSPPPVYDPRSPYTTTLRPYLQLSHLLSLTWLAYPILSLLFVAFRLHISSSSAQDYVSDAKADLLSSCQAAQTAATSAASMPRYLAIAANGQLSDAVNDTMNAARETLILALTVMEAVINFIVDMYRSTFLCFVELVVRGALSILIGFVNEANGFLSSTFSSIRSSIQSDVGSANSAIQSAVDGINKINPFGNISVPQFSIPSLTALENVTLPSDFQSALVTLNSSLPTFSDLKSELDAIIDTPFELVIKEINETFANLTFDVTVLPVPEQNSVTFCDNLDTSVVDDLGHDLLRITKIGIILIVIVALLLLGANCALEWYKWRCMKKHLQNTRDAWTSDPNVYTLTVTKNAPTVEMSDDNLMILQADSQHPLLTKLANRASALFRLSPAQYVHLRFFLHYVFHPPALACFLIGFFGLLSVELQMIAIKPLADKYSDAALSTATDYTNLIATSINGSMYNQSSAYATQVNAHVDLVQSSINDGLFGWVNSTTTTLNNTLNAFYTDLQNAVTTVFNGTVLESPVQEFLRCFIGNKVTDLEDALTFLHNNLYVSLPHVNETALVLSPAGVHEVTQPIATAAIGGGDGSSAGVVGKLIDDYLASLEVERIMFGVFMALWGVVVLMALAVVFWHAYGRGWLEAYRRHQWRREQRAGIDDVVVPFREFGPGAGAAAADRGTADQVDLPSFTPMPSPHPRGGLFDAVRLSMRRQSGPPPAADELLTPPQHPLGMRNPEFGKSWDSFLDRVDTRSAPKISPPMRLVALGRSGLGKERVSDEKAPVELQSSAPQRHVPWYSRMAGMIWKKERSESPAHEKDSIHERTGAPTTITAPQRPWTNAAPSSAWSVAPRPPPKLSFPPPPRKLRPAASVPSDVDSAYGSVSLVPAPAPQDRVAMPLHHGFERPAPVSPASSSQTLVPPPLHPSQKPAPAAMNPDTSTPVTRLLTTHHARHSSQVVDPFVTPFDDEHRAPPADAAKDPFSDPFWERQSVPPSNPFVAMAL